MDLRELPLDDLVLDPNLNLRDRLDEFTVERYTEAWGQMPPVTVFEVEGRWLLADGFHRHAAAVQLGRRTVPAEVRPGTFADALDHAATVNLAHGLPLLAPERRRAVDVKLRLHHDWSDRRLAETLGVSRELVAKTRRNLIEAGQVPNTPGRVGADGKVYPSAGLPRDPNEHLPRGPLSGQDDPRDRGGRESDPPPWDDATDPLPASRGIARLAIPAVDRRRRQGRGPGRPRHPRRADDRRDAPDDGPPGRRGPHLDPGRRLLRGLPDRRPQRPRPVPGRRRRAGGEVGGTPRGVTRIRRGRTATAKPRRDDPAPGEDDLRRAWRNPAWARDGPGRRPSRTSRG